MDQNVRELVSEIKGGLKQANSSIKDETRVMQAMLNDKEFKVATYDSNGVNGSYCPAEDARKMAASVISSTTKISKSEAEVLADAHKFTSSEASSMVGISKEFVNTYVQTGRRLPLGARETSNIKLELKHKPEAVVSVPNDKDRKVTIPAHDTLRVHGSCPSYLKK